jgi:hypothetical protein
MAFKLGKERGLQANGGDIKSKLRFKTDTPAVNGTPILRKKLDGGVMGEANMDGSIYISDQVAPGSELEREILNHEMKHVTDIKIGKTIYTDEYVRHSGITYPRKDGKVLVDGKWIGEGGKLPWESH